MQRSQRHSPATRNRAQKVDAAAPDASDGELVAEALAGRETGYRHLLERHRDPVYRLLRSLTGDADAAMDITQDVNKANTLLKMLPEKMATISGLNAQENMPIRISRSRFMAARVNGFVGEPNKR